MLNHFSVICLHYSSSIKIILNTYFIPPPISSICPAVLSLMIPTKLRRMINYKNRYICGINEEKRRIQDHRKCNRQLLVSRFEWPFFFKLYLYLLEKAFQHCLHGPGFENSTGNNVPHANCEIVCCKCYDEDTHSSVALGPFCGGVECIDGQHH
jgi:hypothetical protein